MREGLNIISREKLNFNVRAIKGHISVAIFITIQYVFSIHSYIQELLNIKHKLIFVETK